MTTSGAEAEGITITWTCASHNISQEHKRANETLQVDFRTHMLISHWPKQVTWPILNLRHSKEVHAIHHKVMHGKGVNMSVYNKSVKNWDQ